MKSRTLSLIAALPVAVGALAADADIQSPDTAATDIFELNEVVVTAVRAPKLLKDIPVQTRLITGTDIRRSDATDIQDLLQQEIPGLEFSYSMNQQTALNFNGQGGGNVLFLVDGERLAGETLDNVDFSRLDMTAVDRIEIVKGPSSALYGSMAGSGVVNIITRDASEPWRVTASARVGRYNAQRYNLSVSNKSRYVQNVFTAFRHSIDNYDVHNDPDPVAREVWTIYGGGTWNFQDRLTVTPLSNLSVTARAGYFFRQVEREADAPQRYRDFTAGATAKWGITTADRLELSYAFDQYDKSDFLRTYNMDIRSYSNVQNSVRTLYNHTFGNADVLTAGAGLMRDYLCNERLVGGKHSQLAADAFAQYDRIFSDSWEVVGALRYDYFSDSNTSRVTPKLSARYRPRRDVTLRLGYGMGFRAPTLKEKYYRFDMAGIWIVNGNPQLKNESSHNFNLSCDYTRRNYNITVSAYLNSIRNRIGTGLPYVRPDEPRQLYLDYINLEHCTVAGAEVALQGRWDNGFSTRLDYAYTHEQVSKNSEGNQANLQYLPARRHSMTARVSYEHSFSKNYGVVASLNGRVLSGLTNREYIDYYDISAGMVTVEYPAYTLWKLSMTQNIGRYVRLTLTVDNLFNYRPAHHYLNSPLTDGTSFLAGLSIDLH